MLSSLYSGMSCTMSSFDSISFEDSFACLKELTFWLKRVSWFTTLMIHSLICERCCIWSLIDKILSLVNLYPLLQDLCMGVEILVFLLKRGSRVSLRLIRKLDLLLHDLLNLSQLIYFSFLLSSFFRHRVRRFLLLRWWHISSLFHIYTG